MSTPQDLFKEYKERMCVSCTKEGNCNIHIVRTNKTATAKCTDYKQLDKCMRNKCDTCKDNLTCFGSGYNE